MPLPPPPPPRPPRPDDSFVYRLYTLLSPSFCRRVGNSCSVPKKVCGLPDASNVRLIAGLRRPGHPPLLRPLRFRCRHHHHHLARIREFPGRNYLPGSLSASTSSFRWSGLEAKRRKTLGRGGRGGGEKEKELCWHRKICERNGFTSHVAVRARHYIYTRGRLLRPSQPDATICLLACRWREFGRGTFSKRSVRTENKVWT